MTSGRPQGEGLPDVVYLAGPGLGRELRHSLRSLKHLPHGRVWIVGRQPSWLKDVERIYVEQRPKRKYANQEANLRAYCTRKQGTEKFLLFNDDFFVMQPIDEVPVWHRGPIGQVVDNYGARTDEYVQRLRATADALGWDALSYDSIHVPMVLEKSKLLEVLDSKPEGALFRSVYGNRWGLGGTVHGDVKVKKKDVDPPDGPFLSTSDGSFREGLAGDLVRETFPWACDYERRLR